MSLYLNELLKSSHQILITLPDGTPIRGFVSSQFTFAGAAAWGENAATEAINKVNEASETIGTVKGLAGMGEGGAFSSGVRPYAATGRTFQGFTVPSIEIPLIFVAAQHDPAVTGPFARDVRIQYNQLLRAVYPEDLKGTGDLLMEKPWKHKFNAKTLQPEGQSTSSIQIGTWFRSFQFWLITSVSGTFSKEPTIDGLPLYANVNVGFTAFRQPKLAEVQSWFR